LSAATIRAHASVGCAAAWAEARLPKYSYFKLWLSAHWLAAADERWRPFDRLFYVWTSPLPGLYQAARSNV